FHGLGGRGVGGHGCSLRYGQRSRRYCATSRSWGAAASAQASHAFSAASRRTSASQRSKPAGSIEFAYNWRTCASGGVYSATVVTPPKRVREERERERVREAHERVTRLGGGDPCGDALGLVLADLRLGASGEQRE